MTRDSDNLARALAQYNGAGEIDYGTTDDVPDEPMYRPRREARCEVDGEYRPDLDPDFGRRDEGSDE